MLNDQSRRLPWHETVLRPMLTASTDAWAYGLVAGTDVFEAARSVVEKRRGRFSIVRGNEPIMAHELFWNASGGKRGSIVFVFSPQAFPMDSVIPHCCDVSVVGNPTIAHTPAAIRSARDFTERTGGVACIFPRSNGFEYFDVVARSDDVAGLFEEALARAGSAKHPNAV